MYAKYTYKAGSTAANILADVVKILTGETNTANLSGDCVAGGTSILTTISTAGWSVYDATAGTNLQVLRAPWHTDNGSGYNYIGIDTNTAGYLILRMYESWNSGTHVGTNEETTLNNNGCYQRVSTTNGGSFEISAQSGHSCALFSLQSGVWGSSNGASPSIVFERTRRSAWDTNANAYPVSVRSACTSTYNLVTTAAVCRLVNASAGDSTAQACDMGTYFKCPVPQNVAGGSPASAAPVDASKSLAHMLCPLQITQGTYGFLGGDVSQYSKIYLTTNSYGLTLDEVTVGGVTYIIWAIGGSYNNRLAVAKG